MPVIVVIVFVAFYLVLVGYLDRPTVEVSVDTHECVKAYGPNGPMSCIEAMKGSYEKIWVDPKKR